VIIDTVIKKRTYNKVLFSAIYCTKSAIIATQALHPEVRKQTPASCMLSLDINIQNKLILIAATIIAAIKM
jgi:hypothetical protein